MKSFVIAIAGVVTAVTASPLVPFQLEDAGTLDKRQCGGCELPCQSDEWFYGHGEIIKPKQIVPISAKHPDQSFGNVKNAIITPNDYCTIFNLFIPGSAAGKVCTLEFLFPEIQHADERSYKFRGGGTFSFSGYVGYGAVESTTWNTQPSAGDPAYNPPNQTIVPGHRYVLNQPYPGSCLVNSSQEYLEVGGRLCSSDTFFEYDQEERPCPIGFYIAVTDTAEDTSTESNKKSIADHWNDGTNESQCGVDYTRWDWECHKSHFQFSHDKSKYRCGGCKEYNEKCKPCEEPKQVKHLEFKGECKKEHCKPKSTPTPKQGCKEKHCNPKPTHHECKYKPCKAKSTATFTKHCEGEQCEPKATHTPKTACEEKHC